MHDPLLPALKRLIAVILPISSDRTVVPMPRLPTLASPMEHGPGSHRAEEISEIWETVWWLGATVAANLGVNNTYAMSYTTAS